MFFSLFNVNLLSCAFFQYFICNVWILCNIMFFLLFVIFGCYIKEREREKKKKKWGRGVKWVVEKINK
jgi:surface polysaccharide O-acyltransferase-like enzyme